MASRKRRPDSRRDSTRAALIEAAESLFAESGVDAVSTRQIGAAIGSANTSVVAYHFGSKEALIREVYRHRLPSIDARRRELMEQADAAGQGEDLAVLVRAFFLPLYEQTDGAGRHSYARFIAALERSGMIATRAEVSAEFPDTDRLTSRIRALLPSNLAALVNERTRLVVGLFSNTLMLVDREAADDPARADRLFENAVVMAVAALLAPVPDGSGVNRVQSRPMGGNER